MKQSVLVRISLLLMAVTTLMSFRKQDGLEAVLSALKAGNAAALIQRSEDNLELILPDQSGVVTKAQAQTQIAKFFAANAVKGFELKHKGNSPGGSYAIGTLKTQNGDYRVNVFLRGKGGKELLRELRIQTMD